MDQSPWDAGLNRLQEALRVEMEASATRTREALRAEIQASATRTQEVLRAEIQASATRTREALRAEIEASAVQTTAALRAEMEVSAGRTTVGLRGEIQTSAAETRQHIDGVETRTRGYMDQKVEENRRHFGVVAESLRSDVQAVAEGLVGLRDDFGAFRLEVRHEFRNMDRRFLTLEGRVARLEDR